MMVRLDEVALASAPPLNFHRYVNGGDPAAVTVKVALAPFETVWLCGGERMEGGTRTVSVATELVIEPAELVITTL